MLLPGRTTFQALKGETLIIHTPGGGGWGKPTQRSKHAMRVLPVNKENDHHETTKTRNMK
jgi:N-methylhydantoinase B/oxoprolinase/acetone carboxylase alpha subunit